jgi:hypothetical protein
MFSTQDRAIISSFFAKRRRTIIRCEQHKGILVDAQLLELFKDIAHAIVNIHYFVTVTFSKKYDNLIDKSPDGAQEISSGKLKYEMCISILH